jgi:phospholipid transport system substrate-binding protein
MHFARILRSTLISLAFAGLLASGVVSAETPTSAPEAQKFLQDLADRTIALLKDANKQDPEKTRATFEAILSDGLDLDMIGRFVLGNAWQGASPELQKQFITLFSNYVLDIYSHRFGTYRGETIKLTGTEPIAGTDVLVDSEIGRPDGLPIKVGWRVRNVGGRMKVVDVVVEGVSMALTQRQEFASVLQKVGLGGLVQDLRDRVQKLDEKPN